MAVSSSATASATVCYHCGDTLRRDAVLFDGKSFCCTGCRSVYQILQQNDLCRYYALTPAPGDTPEDNRTGRYAYLDDPEVEGRLKEFSRDGIARISLTVPTIHCSSCIWLLEHLGRLDPGVLESRVDFLRKRVDIRFREAATSVRTVVELLASLGYPPQVSVDTAPADDGTARRSLYARIGVAGFSFANIMMLSFPEYLGAREGDELLRTVFTWLSVALAVPAFFYSGWIYIRSAVQGLRRRIVNIDVPLALGMIILFVRSMADILLSTGPGFLDSLTGLIFFLLVGKVFQDRTYESLRFDRTYRSYFPLAVMVRKGRNETPVPVAALKAGDRMVIRNGEIVPADAVLIRGSASMDYSFVTGESRPTPVAPGEHVQAGGRQAGGAIELDVLRPASDSHLTRVWQEASAGDAPRAALGTVSTAISGWFTGGVLVLATAAAAFWFPQDGSTAFRAITGVLIVACPCALALAAPFAFGTVSRILGRHGMYLRDTGAVEALAGVTTAVFDKTGTLTAAGEAIVDFVGEELSSEERDLVASLARSSHHPLSRRIVSRLDAQETYTVLEFTEAPGAGITGIVQGREVRLGSAAFVGHSDDGEGTDTRVYCAIDGMVRGFFLIAPRYRTGTGDMLGRLARRLKLAVLSGDSDRERARLESVLNGAGEVQVRFHQSPGDKLNVVTGLQQMGERVLMVGDGLNDAAALRKADVGIAITEDVAAFTPAADAILDARALPRLAAMLELARSSVRIVVVSFAFSFLYNSVALVIAVQGLLSPVQAAILMPLSSVTVVAASTLAVRARARRKGLL